MELSNEQRLIGVRALMEDLINRIKEKVEDIKEAELELNMRAVEIEALLNNQDFAPEWDVAFLEKMSHRLEDMKSDLVALNQLHQLYQAYTRRLQHRPDESTDG